MAFADDRLATPATVRVRTGPGSFRLRRGLLPRRTFFLLLALVATASPLVVLRDSYATGRTSIPAARPAPHADHGDPLIVLSVMGRAWNRWDDGDLSRRDDRVFAPYADVWALGDPLTAPALVAYPFARLSGSKALGYDVAHYLACVVAVAGAGWLLSALAGHGWAALLGALVFGWCPGRLNDLGLMTTLWAGFVPLGLGFLVRSLRRGRGRHLAGAALSWLVLGLGTLYGFFMGSVLAGGFVFLSLLRDRRLARRGAVACAVLAAASALLAAFHSPLFSLKRDFDASVSRQVLEGYSADLLSLAHHGVFSGPLRDLLDRLVPGFPEGAAALFPTLFAVLGLVALALTRRAVRPGRPSVGREAGVWAALAVAMLFLSLGPVIRLAGRPLLPGPYALLAHLPVFDSMRGLNRWDQFFGLAVVSTGTIGLAAFLRCARRTPRVRDLAAAAALLAALVDIWPRRVPALAVPPPSVFAREIAALPEDAVVAYYPFKWSTSVRSWVEQLHHGRRVLNGYQTFTPPIHRWVSDAAGRRPLAEVLAVYRELGASAVEIDLSELSPERRAEAGELLASPPAFEGLRVRVAGERGLLTFDARRPELLDTSTLRRFPVDGGAVVLARAPGRLVFRVGGSRLPVRVVTPTESWDEVLSVPLVSAGVAVARTVRPLPAGGRVEALGPGR